MRKNDWIGLSVSLLVHALLLISFSLLTAAAPEKETIGYIEVEFGPIAAGRPVQKAPEEAPEEKVEPKPAPPQPAKQAAPKEARPVNLPDQPKDLVDPDRVKAPKTDVVSPVTQDKETPEQKKEDKPAAEPVRPLGSGKPDGDRGGDTGTPGKSSDEAEAAPYEIEGLNRELTYAPVPPYAEKVNATISVRIVVSPQGRVVSATPIRKASPALERAIQETLRQRWRFNPLPRNVPQENQTGIVTFRFRLE